MIIPSIVWPCSQDREGFAKTAQGAQEPCQEGAFLSFFNHLAPASPVV